MFGKGDGAWINWVGRWTAEEGRHAIVLRDYLMVTRNIDPIAARARPDDASSSRATTTTRPTRSAGSPTSRSRSSRPGSRTATPAATREDPVADRIMVRIAADENLHMVFYRDILARRHRARSRRAAVQAIVAEVLAFEMPGAGIPGFMRKAAAIAKAGIYDIRVHRDEVLMPILRHWRHLRADRARRRGRGRPRDARPASRRPRGAARSGSNRSSPRPASSG